MEKIDSDVRGLPVYGVGHSTGALLALLINSRFSMRCDGNALLSYNNRPAHDVIPFLAPFVAPGARAVGPFLSQATANPVGTSMASLYDTAKTLSPSLVKMGLPAIEQISPMFMDVVCGYFGSARMSGQEPAIGHEELPFSSPVELWYPAGTRKAGVVPKPQ